MEKRTVRFNISFPIEIDKMIQNEAQSWGMSKAFYVRYLFIKAMLEQKGSDKKLEDELRRMAK